MRTSSDYEAEINRLQKENEQLRSLVVTLIQGAKQPLDYEAPQKYMGPDSMIDSHKYNILRGLTPKQNVVLQMVLDDIPSHEIAKAIGTSDSTVKAHIRLIARKLGVVRRAQIITAILPIINRLTDEEFYSATGGSSLVASGA